jgi:dolichol-phosphate mannosyltransferase
MFSLSVVLPVLGDPVSSTRELVRLREHLIGSGQFTSVELILVAGRAGNAECSGVRDQVRRISVAERGAVSLVHAGLRAATGELAVVVDPSHGYQADSILKVLAPLIQGRADLAVGLARRGKPYLSRRPGVSGGDRAGTVGVLLRPVLGTAAPFSGLIGIRRSAADAVLATAEARAKKPTAGSFFVLDLVSRLPGRRIDVAVDRDHRGRFRRPALNDLRQVKRLLDDRFGNYSRLAQFCMVGASGMIVDLSFYAFFQWLFSRPWLFSSDQSLFGSSWQLASAGGLSIFLALIWNFALNRRLTFNDAMEGNLLHQFVAYTLGNALGVALSFSLRLYLPARLDFFNRHKLAAAVVGIVAATGISFSMSRWVVFSRRVLPPEPEASDPLPAP